MHASMMPSPATVYLMMDSGNYYANHISETAASGSNVYVPGMGSVVGTTGSITDTNLAQDYETGRHFGGVNVGYGDGHVKWVQTSQLFTEAKKLNAPTGCGTAVPCTQIVYGAWNPANSF